MPEDLSNPAENLPGDSTPEAGLFARVENTRNIRGLLLPFGELSRPNASGNAPVMFTKGSVKLPRDHSVVTLNTEHDRFNPIGRAIELRETERGIEATFALADTDEADAWLAQPTRKLSAEVAGLVRDGIDKVRATFARLTGAAVVVDGAFESAALEGALFSVAPDDEAKERIADPDDYAAFIQEVEAHINAAKALIENRLSESDEDEEQTPDAAPAQVTETADNEEFSMADTNDAGATVPATLLGNAPAPKALDLNAVFGAIAAIKSGTPGQTAEAETMLAALADIKAESTGGLTTAGSGVIPPTFAGRLWQGKRYQSRYIDLANHTYGGIALGGRKGFKVAQGTALVAEVANAAQKVELPTGTASTSLYGSTLRKFGYAADYALEWQYLEGGADVMQAFFEGVVDSAAKIIDESALKDIFTVASRGSGAALSRLVAPATYPTQYPAAMGQLIQGIDLIADNGDDATFAIVNPTAWTQLLYTPKDLVPEFVEFGVGIGTGEATAGKVRVVKAPASFFTGLGAAKPQVIVGAKNAIEFREQQAEIDALEVAKFGVDRALVAFLETFVVREESVSIIGAV
ncbi:hypothetical protein [Microbacterium kunmingense]|uniref:hypothetical protein n=1 Tax=Microbacterium kunmingense TaxID=2915939 RepID=UPI002006878B|nr:hypothetical protein [Microbacterium kunmingense]